GGALGAFNRVVTRGTNGYRASLGRILRWRVPMVILFFCGLGLTWVVYQRVPKGFIPEDDQGYFIVAVQAPDGASLGYTTGIITQVEAALSQEPDILGAFSVAGFSFAGTAPNRALVFGTLKPFGERSGEEHAAAAIINRLR